MVRTNLLFTLIAIFAITGIAKSQTTGWNNGGGNWQRNGYADIAGPTSDSVLWQVNPIGFFGTPVFIEGNYLVTMRFNSPTNAPVECYDLNTGNLIWSEDVTNAAGRSLPVGLRDQRVYVVRFTESLKDSLFALDVSNGSRIWTSNVTVAPYISETAVFDSTGNIYIAGNLKTFKINPITGKMIWQTSTVPMASGSGEMAINNSKNTGYTLEQNGGVSYVWAINLTTGAKKYSHIVNQLQAGGNLPQSALMVGNNGVIYIQLTEDNVAAFSDDGTQLTMLWQTGISGNSSFSLMCVGSDGSVYAPTAGKIVRLDPKTGAILNTSASITQGGFYSPRISATNNGMIYATNGENYVYALDLDLNLVWSDYVPNTNTSGVCIAPGGLAVVAGQNVIKAYGSTNTTAIHNVNNATVKIFPNPTSSYLVISLDNLYLESPYMITDVLGKVIMTGTLQNNSNLLNIEHFQPGLYLLKIEGMQQSFNLIKN